MSYLLTMCCLLSRCWYRL